MNLERQPAITPEKSQSYSNKIQPVEPSVVATFDLCTTREVDAGVPQWAQNHGGNNDLYTMHPATDQGINIHETDYQFAVPSIYPRGESIDVPPDSDKIQGDNNETKKEDDEFEIVEIDGVKVKRKKKILPPAPTPDMLEAVTGGRGPIQQGDTITLGSREENERLFQERLLADLHAKLASTPFDFSIYSHEERQQIEEEIARVEAVLNVPSISSK